MAVASRNDVHICRGAAEVPTVIYGIYKYVHITWILHTLVYIPTISLRTSAEKQSCYQCPVIPHHIQLGESKIQLRYIYMCT